jgi:hypothetical protein
LLLVSTRRRRKRNRHYASTMPALPAAARKARAPFITMRSRRCLRLSFRTGLERTAPESLTGPVYAFVHGHILLSTHSLPLDQGRVQFQIAPNALQRLTASAMLSQSVPHTSHCQFSWSRANKPPVLYHNGPDHRPAIKFWNESGTNHARIADSPAMRVRSRRYLDISPKLATISSSSFQIH